MLRRDHDAQLYDPCPRRGRRNGSPDLIRYVLRSNEITLSGPKDLLDRANAFYSVRNESVVWQLQRFERTCAYRERSGRIDDDYEEWKIKKKAEIEAKLRVRACRWEGDQLICPIGFFENIKQFFGGLGIWIKGKDERNFDLPKRILTGSKKDLRPYQRKAVDVAIEKMGGMLKLATASGKTEAAVEIIRHFGVRSIFLVPSSAILNQTVKRFEGAFGKRNVAAYGDGKKRLSYVTVATYQGVYAAKESLDEFDLVVGDEAHHLPAETFKEVYIKKLSKAVYRFGLSADEERADGLTLLVEAACGPVIYSYEAPEAIKDGYLAKPTFVVYGVSSTEGRFVKWENEDGERKNVGFVQSHAYTGDDLHLAYKNWVLGNDLLSEFVAGLVKEFASEGKNSLVLVDEKEHGEKLIDLIPDAAFVYGGNPLNEEILREFNARTKKVIVGTSAIGEGADTVSVDLLVNLMGGRRPKQANGRALRNDPDENGVPRKPTVLIVDFRFPNCKSLDAHADARIPVHQTCGDVHHLDAPLKGR